MHSVAIHATIGAIHAYEVCNSRNLRFQFTPVGEGYPFPKRLVTAASPVHRTCHSEWSVSEMKNLFTKHKGLSTTVWWSDMT